MEDRAERAEGARAIFEGRNEVVRVNVVAEAQRYEVAPLLRLVEAIDGDDIVNAAPIERPDEGAADEAGGAGNDDRAS